MQAYKYRSTKYGQNIVLIIVICALVFNIPRCLHHVTVDNVDDSLNSKTEAFYLTTATVDAPPRITTEYPKIVLQKSLKPVNRRQW